MTDYKDPASVRAAITRSVIGATPPNRSNLPVVVVALVLLALIAVWLTFTAKSKQLQPKETATDTLPVVVPSLDPERLAEIKPYLEDVKDGEDFVENDNYLEGLRLLRKIEPSDFTSGEIELMDRNSVLAHPETFRGARVRTMGLVATIAAVRLKHGDRAGTPDVWRGILTQPDGTEGIAFEIPAPPGQFEARWDVVQLDGLFYRVVRYDQESGKSELIPYILARSLERAPKEKLKKSFGIPEESMPLIMLGLAGVWIIYRLTTLRRKSVGPASDFGRSRRIAMRPLRPSPEKKPN